MKIFNDTIRGPAEKAAIRKGVIAALLTDSLLFGWIFVKNNSKYDFKKRRLK